jgi:hypothetical protein
VTYVEANAGLGMTVSGNRLYTVADWDGLVILDVTDPSSPSRLGSMSLPDGYFDGVAVAGDFAYVVGDRFRVIDVSDPSSPVVVGATVRFVMAGTWPLLETMPMLPVGTEPGFR